MATNYPDITPLLAAKQQRRQELAALAWEEKMVIVEKMRRLLPRHQWRRPDAPAVDATTPVSTLESHFSTQNALIRFPVCSVHPIFSYTVSSFARLALPLRILWEDQRERAEEVDELGADRARGQSMPDSLTDRRVPVPPVSRY